MNKYKTVKDLPAIDLSEEIPALKERFLSEISLKKEAIKWVKKAKEIENGCTEIQNWQGVSYHAGFQKALKVFHNITEEDLKQKEEVKEE